VYFGSDVVYPGFYILKIFNIQKTPLFLKGGFSFE